VARIAAEGSQTAFPERNVATISAVAAGLYAVAAQFGHGIIAVPAGALEHVRTDGTVWA